VEHIGGTTFVVDGVEFVTAWERRPSIAGSFTLLKSDQMVESYRELLARFPDPRIVELGILQGGSVALLALVARPRKLVAIELDETPVEPLLDLIRERGWEGSVRPYFGVDQADRERVAAIVAGDFGGEPLDLVVDDASHVYGPSVASFEVLFPLLRPGGAYVIEDWAGQDVMASAMAKALQDPDSPMHEGIRNELAQRPRRVPLSRMAIELTLASAQSSETIAGLTIDRHWVVVHRGGGRLDPASFRLQDLYEDHFQLLTAAEDAAG
jgi:predicted O-methyltransferase YrrM